MALCITHGNPACLLLLLWGGARLPGELLIAPAGHPGSMWNLEDISFPWLSAPQVGFAEPSVCHDVRVAYGRHWIFSNSWILLLFVRIHLYVSEDISYLWVSVLLGGWLRLFSNKSICMTEGDFKHSWFLSYYSLSLASCVYSVGAVEVYLKIGSGCCSINPAFEVPNHSNSKEGLTATCQ